MLPSKYPGAKKIKLRYGPYSVPSMSKKNGIGAEGMLSNYPDDKLMKPCDGECTIIGMKAGLEYPDTKNANINTGMWLHHVVLFNKGQGRTDDTCAQRDISVPHVSVLATPRNSERIFASGNERSVMSLPDWGIKDTGYKLKPTDTFAALVELMNMNMEDKVVYWTMEYDIMEGHPYKDNTKVIWFDVRNCGTSEYNPPKGQSTCRPPYILAEYYRLTQKRRQVLRLPQLDLHPGRRDPRRHRPRPRRRHANHNGGRRKTDMRECSQVRHDP